MPAAAGSADGPIVQQSDATCPAGSGAGSLAGFAADALVVLLVVYAIGLTRGPQARAYRGGAGSRRVDTMASAHLELLTDPVAEQLLTSSLPARLAYCWTDGTPRVVPIAFHWDGNVFTFGTQPHAPKVAPLRANPEVAITIDDNVFPYKALLVRGTASVEVFDEMVPQYGEAVVRYFGAEMAAAWLEPVRSQPMARIQVRPHDVRILDFETRFPSAMSA